MYFDRGLEPQSGDLVLVNLVNEADRAECGGVPGVIKLLSEFDGKPILLTNVAGYDLRDDTIVGVAVMAILPGPGWAPQGEDIERSAAIRRENAEQRAMFARTAPKLGPLVRSRLAAAFATTVRMRKDDISR